MKKKLYDIEVPLGKFIDKHGNEKTRWQNVGAMFEGDKGPFLLLDRWFNPGGLPNPDNRTSVLLSLYDARKRE